VWAERVADAADGDLYGDRVVLKHHGPDLLDQYRSVRHVYQVGIACGADDSSTV
jgi:hypothetical protein